MALCKLKKLVSDDNSLLSTEMWTSWCKSHQPVHEHIKVVKLDINLKKWISEICGWRVALQNTVETSPFPLFNVPQFNVKYQ
jgi:hypothetical protein